MTKLRNIVAAAALAAVAFLPSFVAAQSVTPQPAYIASDGANDFGNGPVEMKVLQGNAAIAAATSSGTVASSTATLLTMSATPTLPPCVGCVIQGATAATTSVVTSSGNTITLAATIGAVTGGSTTIAWGIPCTTSPPAGVRVAPVSSGQPGGTDLPFYSYGRICGYGANGPGAMVLTFPIGAH